MPVITKPNQHFDATLYTGNGGTQSITSLGFQPDFVWVKSRSTGSTNHLLGDVIRGTKKSLISNGTNAELTRGINAFLSNGFSFNDDAGGDGNVSSQTYVAWNWKAGGAAVTNTSGTITSQVSANPTAGFSVVTYTGTGSGTPTVGHGLGVAPSMIFIKSRSNAVNWGVGHVSAGWSNAGLLNATNSFGSSSYFASTAPTSTVFSIQDNTVTNIGSATYVAYCFAPIAGYSAFGSYTGNGSTDGPFAYTGFRPRFVMVKASSFSTSSTVWNIWDTSRSPSNAALKELYPNSYDVEGTDSDGCDILSNGFKPKRNSEYANSSGQTYIYMAFAEAPFKYSSAR